MARFTSFEVDRHPRVRRSHSPRPAHGTPGQHIQTATPHTRPANGSHSRCLRAQLPEQHVQTATPHTRLANRPMWRASTVLRPYGAADRQMPSPDRIESARTSHAFASRGNLSHTLTRHTQRPRSRVSHRSARKNRKSGRNLEKISLLPVFSCCIFHRPIGGARMHRPRGARWRTPVEVPRRFPVDAFEMGHPAGWGSSDRRTKWRDSPVSK